MNSEIKKIENPIQSYLEINREKLNESLVSLRLMKEIDLFLEEKNMSNKTMALDLGYSESFISQLMSGVKKINTSFINKFEKSYNVRINFSIVKEEKEDNFISISSMSYLNINLNISNFNSKISNMAQTFNYDDRNEYVEYEEIDSNYL